LAQRTIKGMPAWKYWQEMRAKGKPLKRTPIKRSTKRIRKVGLNPRTRKGKISGLADWYLEQVSNCMWVCDECGVYCFSSNRGMQISVQAHALPKEHFRSVATHLRNILCLGVDCGCHGKYDTSWADAKEMKVWPKAKDIIIGLVPLLTTEELNKLSRINSKHNLFDESTLGNTS
jgi:hypothetical protein